MKKLTYAVMMLLTLGVMAACSESDDDEKTATTPASIEGTWVSTGSNLSPGLVELWALYGITIDTIYASFESNKNYTVKQINRGRAATVYSGTYQTVKSQYGNIYQITANQTVPNAATAEGIFEIYDVAIDSMKYEVIQTSGTTNTGANPKDGFGSTNAGKDAKKWVQRYVRLK